MSDLLHLQKPSVVFLQEIWLPFHEQVSLCDHFPDYPFRIAKPEKDMFSNPEDVLHNPANTWHGVAIGWRRDDINASIEVIENIHDKFVGIRMSIGEKNVLLISFYAPTAGQDDDFLESISYLSDFIRSNASASDAVITLFFFSIRTKFIRTSKLKLSLKLKTFES